MSSRRLFISSAVAIAAVCMGLTSHAADDTVKVGIIGHFTGPYAVAGARFRQGIDAYVATHGTTVGGRKIEIVYRDMAGGDPSRAKQFAEELIVKDEVSIIGGFYLSPETMAAGPVLTRAKVPGVAFIGSSSAIVKSSPYIVRAAGSIAQTSQAEADYAVSRGFKKAYLVVSDYSPGSEMLGAFRKRFTELGGTILGEEKVPLSTVDYSPVAERVAAANADAVVTFVPSGAPSVAFVKALAARGLLAQKDKLVIGWGWLDGLEPGTITGPIESLYNIQVFPPKGMTPESTQFYKSTKGEASYESTSAYDGMAIIYHMVAAQVPGQPFDSQRALQATWNHEFDGARGKQLIEADSHGLRVDVHMTQAQLNKGVLDFRLVHTASAVPATQN